MVNLLIYGIKMQAQQLCYYAELEGAARVVGFVVDAEYQTITELNGHPVITFEEAVKQYPSSEYEFAVSFAYQHMVHDREEKSKKCKNAGYRLFTFISKSALCYSNDIGEGCIIYPGACIEFGAVIGDGNIIDHNVLVGHGSHIGNWNYITAMTTICGEVSIGEHNFLGANCTVMDSAKIGNEVIVGAGAVVRNAEDGSVYFPARTVKWHGNSSEIKI